MIDERILEELLEALAGAEVEVRELAPTKDDPDAQSGLVVLRGRRVLFLNPSLAPTERIPIVARTLAGLDLDNLYLSPAARKIVEGASNQ